MIWQLNRLLNVTNAIVICERYKVTQTFHTTKRKQYFFGSNIEYNPKFLSKIKKALSFQCLIVLFISTGSSNLDDRFSH